jgi:hypothetical protein
MLGLPVANVVAPSSKIVLAFRSCNRSIMQSKPLMDVLSGKLEATSVVKHHLLCDAFLPQSQRATRSCASFPTSSLRLFVGLECLHPISILQFFVELLVPRNPQVSFA